MNHIVKANIEGLIWIVVGIFWVIAQVAGAASKKKRPAPARPEKDDSSDDSLSPQDAFAELLRKLSGTEEIRIEPPEFIEEEPEEPDRFVSSQARWTQERLDQLPDIQPQISVPSPPVFNRTPAQVPDIDVRPKMAAFRCSIPIIKLPSVKLQITAPVFTGGDPGKQGVGQQLNLKEKDALRRAMLGHIIFSPPKALEQHPSLF